MKSNKKIAKRLRRAARRAGKSLRDRAYEVVPGTERRVLAPGVHIGLNGKAEFTGVNAPVLLQVTTATVRNRPGTARAIYQRVKRGGAHAVRA